MIKTAKHNSQRRSLTYWVSVLWHQGQGSPGLLIPTRKFSSWSEFSWKLVLTGNWTRKRFSSYVDQEESSPSTRILSHHSDSGKVHVLSVCESVWRYGSDCVKFVGIIRSAPPLWEAAHQAQTGSECTERCLWEGPSWQINTFISWLSPAIMWDIKYKTKQEDHFTFSWIEIMTRRQSPLVSRQCITSSYHCQSQVSLSNQLGIMQPSRMLTLGRAPPVPGHQDGLVKT